MDHASYCSFSEFGEEACTCHVNDVLPPELRSSSRRPFHRKKVDYATESMTFIADPEVTKCEICHFFVAAYLPDAGVHETVHDFLSQSVVDIEKFDTQMTRQEQIACFPYLLFKPPPEDDHIPGPPVNGFMDPIRAPNPYCKCFICQLFSQGEYLYCRAMDTAFMTEDMEKICSGQDYMTIKGHLRMIYKTMYPKLREQFKKQRRSKPRKKMIKNLKKKEVSTTPVEKPVEKSSSESTPAPPPAQPPRDRSTHKQKKEEKKKEEKKSDKKQAKTRAEQKENIKPEQTPAEPKPALDPRIVHLQERKSELESLMARASYALIGNQSHMAIKVFNEVLAMFTKYHHDYFNKDQSEVLLVRYCLGKASVDTGEDVLILEGIGHYQTILKVSKNVKFPLGYLGLGEAYCRQNRWELALPEFRRGLNLVIAGSYRRTVLNWPGTNTVIPETQPGKLREAFEEYIATCNNPPKPDAVCRYAYCTGHYKIQIYLTDPDFKGYVRVKCFAQCMVEYHTECWKKVRSLSKERHSDKDLLNGPCFTPDCISTISMIIIFDDTGKALREIEATRPQNRICAAKKVEKLQASSVAKMSRKQEKKRIRKERKEEEKRKKAEEMESEKLLAQIDNMQEKASVSKPIELEGVTAAAAIPEETNAANSVNLEKLTMLKKLDSDSDENMSYKASKKSKKKKKQIRDKRVFTLGASYFENENAGEGANSSKTNDKTQIPATSTGMDGLDDFGDVGNTLNRGLNNSNPFSIPDSIRNDVAEFERTLPPQKLDKLGDPVVEEQYLAKNKDIKETIFSLFAILLKESGPLHVSDRRIEEEVDNFPMEARNLIQSAGGIGHFLSKSLQFFHKEGYICLMVDAPKAHILARTSKQQGVEAKVSKPRTRVLPPDTRSRDQFPTLGATASEDSSYSQYHKNRADVLQNQQTVRPSSRDNVLRRETSTPDSEYTSSSDPLDNFLSAQLSQTLSQSSMDDREKTDVALETLTNRDSVDDLKSPLTTVSEASSNLFMPSAYGDSKSQESNISDGLASGFMSNIIPNTSSQASIESSSEVGIPMSVDTTKEDHDTIPPMTSPGLIHDIMGAKPLNHLSLIDHPLLKAPISNDPKPQDSAESNIDDEKRNGDVGESPTREEQELETVDHNVEESVNEQSNPLPEARLDREPLPHSSPVHRKMDLLAPGPRLTPEQATITPPRPRNTSPKPHEPEFSMLGSVLPPHPDTEGYSSTSSPVASMDSLISMPTTSLGNTSMPAWMNADIAANLGTANASVDRGLSSPSRSLGFHRGSSLPPHPSEVDEQLKQEIAEDVFQTMSQYSAFRDNPDLKKNILSDIEKDFQSSSEHSGSLSPARSFKFGKYAESDSRDKAAQTEQDMVSRGTNTEGENFEPLYQRAMIERNHMQAQLQDLLDKYTQLQKNSQVSVNTVLGQLEENRLQTRGELRAVQETMQRMKIEHQAETQKLQHQLRLTKDLEESLTLELGSREQKIAELNRKITEEQNNRLQMQQIITTYQEAQMREYDRAQTAEVHLLELKRDIGGGIMERSFKDAESWIRNCAVQLRVCVQQKREPPPQLATLMSQWKDTADKIKQIQTQSTEAFNEQINKVRSGEQLSDLPVIPIPHPPPPPEGLQGGPQGEPRFPNPMMVNMRPPGFGPNTRMPSPTETTSPLTVQPTPASLAALASQSSLKTNTAASSAQINFSNNTADKNKAKSLAKGEVNTVRVERQRNSFIKLMDALGKIFPNYTREELDEYVKRLRSSRGGSLNGMGMDEIVTQVSDMIFRDQQTKMSKYNPQSVQSLPLVSNLVRRSSTPEIYDEEEDPCTICHEEMKPGTTKMLECKHYFHDRCIRKWYREKNECPVCRKYAPLDDEFPAL